ncbi:arylesterase [Mesobaculum littorinae]|uniref:Arylesterase n=1 Tax=Mesobaculum littorinae TaxID=2486419 RepID=A0A438AKW1_9RHOB|nr:GDSL-type esterase/lipase family protein [Mesobaculum littorinae]RVV99358.1 arylesterase [Mesobaculum littorinae]
MSDPAAILAFGDSLTWGHAPEGGRHALADRWPSALGAGLRAAGQEVRILAEGLNGRTLIHDDWCGPADRNGARLLPTLLATHQPLAAVVILLGTNDLVNMAVSARRCGQGMRALGRIVQRFPYEAGQVPKLVLVAPPMVEETPGGVVTAAMADEAQALAAHYAAVAKELGAGFLDAGRVARVSPVDGIHLDPAATRAIGAGLVPALRLALG